MLVIKNKLLFPCAKLNKIILQQESHKQKLAYILILHQQRNNFVKKHNQRHKKSCAHHGTFAQVPAVCTTRIFIQVQYPSRIFSLLFENNLLSVLYKDALSWVINLAAAQIVVSLVGCLSLNCRDSCCLIVATCNRASCAVCNLDVADYSLQPVASVAVSLNRSPAQTVAASLAYVE